MRDVGVSAMAILYYHDGKIKIVLPDSLFGSIESRSIGPDWRCLRLPLSNPLVGKDLSNTGSAL